MIIIAILFWIFIGLAVMGGIIYVVSFFKGEKHPDNSSSLPGPIRKALGHWF